MPVAFAWRAGVAPFCCGDILRGVEYPFVLLSLGATPSSLPRASRARASNSSGWAILLESLRPKRIRISFDFLYRIGGRLSWRPAGRDEAFCSSSFSGRRSVHAATLADFPGGDRLACRRLPQGFRRGQVIAAVGRSLLMKPSRTTS